MVSTDQLVKKITSTLTDKGVLVKVQPSVSTSSVYLNFDNGVLGQCRVGDHRGKGYAYTFEIGDHISRLSEADYRLNGRTIKRYFYPSKNVEDLIVEVLIRRTNLRSKYGSDRYADYVGRGGYQGVEN